MRKVSEKKHPAFALSFYWMSLFSSGVEPTFHALLLNLLPAILGWSIQNIDVGLCALFID